MNVDPRALVGRLNHDTRNALEGAAGLCVSRTHYDVEIEHILSKMLDDTSNDAAQILKHFDVDRSRLAKSLAESLDSLKTGNPRTPALSPKLVDLLSNAWLICSLEQRAHQIRTGHVILALVSDANLRRLATEISREFENVSAEELKEGFGAIISKSSEEEDMGTEPDAPGAPGKPTKTPKLDQYTHNLTERARLGEMDPVLGRDFEVRQVVDILTR
ncbi:MAG: type VI secretion system ATPase TssH, partial [Gemmatimonadales bacterium]